MNVPKLYYFGIYGKAEPIRMLLSYAGANFEDCRLTQEEFRKMKAKGDLPGGQVPVYIDEQGNKLN